jgi:hypothetical protein
VKSRCSSAFRCLLLHVGFLGWQTVAGQLSPWLLSQQERFTSWYGAPAVRTTQTATVDRCRNSSPAEQDFKPPAGLSAYLHYETCSQLGVSGKSPVSGEWLRSIASSYIWQVLQLRSPSTANTSTRISAQSTPLTIIMDTEKNTAPCFKHSAGVSKPSALVAVLRAVQYVVSILALVFVSCAIDRNILVPGVTSEEKVLAVSVSPIWLPAYRQADNEGLVCGGVHCPPLPLRRAIPSSCGRHR